MSKEEQKTYGKGKYIEKDFKNLTEEKMSDLDFILARAEWLETNGTLVSLDTDEEIKKFLGIK